jgi:hypothetical protein
LREPNTGRIAGERPSVAAIGKPCYLEEISSIGELLADRQRRATERQAGKVPAVVPGPDDDPDVILAALKQALARLSQDFAFYRQTASLVIVDDDAILPQFLFEDLDSMMCCCC